MLVGYYYKNCHSILYFQDATLVAKSRDESDLPTRTLIVKYYNPNCTEPQTKEFQITQPKNAFRLAKTQSAAVKQQSLVMTSQHFDYNQYMRTQGFLDRKFWTSNIYFGATYDIMQNLNAVKLKLKTTYNSLDMLPTLMQAKQDQEQEIRERQLRERILHLENVNARMKKNQEFIQSLNIGGQIFQKETQQPMQTSAPQHSFKADKPQDEKVKIRVEPVEKSKSTKPKQPQQVIQTQKVKKEFKLQKTSVAGKLPVRTQKTPSTTNVTSAKTKEIAAPMQKTKAISKGQGQRVRL